MRSLSNLSLILLLIISLVSCGNEKTDSGKSSVIKGLYTFGPKAALFVECKTGKEYWTADSSAMLESKYSQMTAGKPYSTVYIEVEGEIKPTVKDGPASTLDSTLIVKKLIAIKKDIQNGICK